MALITWWCPNDLSGGDDSKILVYRGPHRSELEHNALDQVSNSVKSIPFCALAQPGKKLKALQHGEGLGLGAGGVRSSIIVAACLH